MTMKEIELEVHDFTVTHTGRGMKLKVEVNLENMINDYFIDYIFENLTDYEELYKSLKHIFEAINWKFDEN